jgi:pimeloyl-ACP methyl ester carboxylesterase
MATVSANGIELHYEIEGEGPPLVLVHGNWSDHTSWGLLAPHLARSFRVLRYDRRAHGRSGSQPGPTARRQNEDDLIALIESVFGEPAHVVGNSYGGLVSLAVAASRPDLVQTLSVHEPPALSLPGTGEFERQMEVLRATLRVVAAEIEGGEIERGTRRFMEEAALGEGAWALFPEEMRSLFFSTAHSFAAEVSAAHWTELDLAGVRRSARPVLLTKGDASPEWLPLIVDRLAELLPDAGVATVAGAGHAPHETHPADYAEQIRAFAQPAGALEGANARAMSGVA